NSSDFTSINTHGKLIPTVPLELSKGFSKKRIDHRHHALYALVIALATRSHINYLNNTSAKVEDSKNEEKKKKQIEQRNKLKNNLCYKTKTDEKGNYKWIFYKPWETLTQDTRQALESVVVSFKQNLRVINKATNYYESYKDENGNLRLDKNGKPKKDFVAQKGINWAIRKSLHAETVSSLVHLPWVKLGKGEKLTATRERNFLDSSFTTEKISKITDTGIQIILLNRLSEFDECNEVLSKTKLIDYIEKRKELIKSKILKEFPENAFSPEGIEEMNKNIKKYNDDKSHQPILKVRIYEKSKGRFPLGETGNKTKKFVEAAKGTNLFFGIYTDKSGKRSYETIPLNVVIERQKQGLQAVPETNEKGNQLLFHLSPNDLVYVPTIDDNEQLVSSRVYKMVSSTGNECHFIKANISSLIKNYDAKTKLGEMGSLNKLEVTAEGDFRIKEICIKLKVDRLGNISKA
ncbi:MAG: type II CRISPR RNA-guided endonuclease Cas9, partial [Empedobacter falsenii]